MIALTVSVLKIPLLVVALPLVYLHLSSEIRIVRNIYLYYNYFNYLTFSVCYGSLLSHLAANDVDFLASTGVPGYSRCASNMGGP